MITQTDSSIEQFYTIAMYELKVDPVTIAAIRKRVEDLKKEDSIVCL
jgi:hypothetical protein